MVPINQRKNEDSKRTYYSIKLKHVLSRFVHESQLHVATQLFQDNFGRFSEPRIVGFRKDTNNNKLSRQLMSLGIESESGSKFSSNTRHQSRYPSLESSLLGAVAARCASAAWCAVLNDGVYTLCEAEHVHAHTVETTLAQLEHHNKNGYQDYRIVNAIQSKCSAHTKNGSTTVRTCDVVTSSTSVSIGISDFRTCPSAAFATSTSNARSLRSVSVIKPGHSAAQWSSHAIKLRYHACTPVPPWIVTRSVLHGVWDVLFPRSCFWTRNRVPESRQVVL